MTFNKSKTAEEADQHETIAVTYQQIAMNSEDITERFPYWVNGMTLDTNQTAEEADPLEANAVTYS